MVDTGRKDSTLFTERGIKLWISGFFGFSGRVESGSGFFGFGFGSGRVEIFNPIENSIFDQITHLLGNLIFSEKKNLPKRN